ISRLRHGAWLSYVYLRRRLHVPTTASWPSALFVAPKTRRATNTDLALPLSRKRSRRREIRPLGDECGASQHEEDEEIQPAEQVEVADAKHDEEDGVAGL